MKGMNLGVEMARLSVCTVCPLHSHNSSAPHSQKRRSLTNIHVRWQSLAASLSHSTRSSLKLAIALAHTHTHALCHSQHCLRIHTSRPASQ